MPSRKAPVPSAATQQVNFRLPKDVWQWLSTAAGVLGQPHSRIVTEALERYRATLPAATRRIIDDALALRQKPS